MSSVDKLLIRGIRSFDPENPNVIQFYSPLTLIVGANGSGKTTIIECLKYACTGDLPPNSKGGAFIHDTKLAGKAEVKAQIKLKFRNVRGTHMTCTRSMSLTQTKTTAKLKTLESLLQTRNEETGETYSISTRCAELDAELPLHLGVPKAILDNVIFCHQEESNWPLSEASILKKKFDEIFSSTKYTKALVNIKDLRKNRNENLRVDTQKLQAMTSDKEKAAKIRKTVALMKNEMTKKRQGVTALDQKMHEVATEIDSLLAKVQELQSLEAKLEQKVHQMQVTGENRDELAANMKMMALSDAELERMKEQHQSRISTDEEARKHIAEEQSELEGQLKAYQQQLLDKMTQLGKLQAEKDANEQRVKDRKDIVLRANQRYSFLDLSGEDIGDDDIHRFEEKLARLIEEKQSTRLRLKKESSDKREELDSEIQLVRSEKTSLEEGIKFTKKQLEINQQNIKRLTSQMKEIKASKSEIDYLRQKFEQAQNDLKASRNDSLAENLPEQLADKERELRDVDDGISALNDEITVLNKQGDTRAKLSLKKQDRERLSATLNGLYSDCKEPVQRMLGHEPTIDSLEQDTESAEETKDQQLRNANKQLSDLIGKVSSAETKLNIAQADFNKKKNECQVLEEQIRQVCNNERLPDMIADCEAEIQENKSMLSGVDGAVEMYKRFLAAAKKTDTCPLCRRGFHDTSEMDVLVKKLDELMIKQPQQVRGIKREIVDLEERLSRLKQAQPSWNKLIQLRDVELDICKNSEAELQEAKQQLATETEKMKETVHTLEEEKKNISNVKRKVEDVVRIGSEIRVLADEIQSLEEELSISGSTKTIDECSREMEQLADKGRALRRAVKALHDDRTRQSSKAQLLEVKVRDAREELVNMEQKLQTKENIQAQIDSLLSDSKTLEPSQSQNDDRIATLSAKIGELSQNLRRFQESSAQEQDGLQQEINSMEHDFQKLTSFATAIQMYVEKAGPDQLTRCMEEKKTLDRKVESVKVQTATLSSKLAEIEKRLSEVKTLERDLTDNLRYRAAVSNIEKLQVEIRELQGQLQQWDNTSYESHLETLQNRQAELIDKRGGIQGELRQMDDQIERYEHDLKTEYKDIDKLHRKHFIGVRASEMAIADMNKYASALEKAIMRFHALKMEDLNKIIKELWINTYKGGDIDYIEIQSDNDGPASNRSYNYRVMMVQNGVKMQMRGRCSAGQKVLTSIIIRLALAETFCINCGILALDEPTTNLDRDNIESLATSLASIIRVRRKQANFQLIVITHDEEFVDFLGRSDIAEYYYRVHKDDRQHSVIESFDELNTNTMQWFDGEDNQNPSVASGNTQLPNSTSSFSPLIFGLMNNQATRQPDLPVFDDIDILTYLMQADSENILAANTAASTSAMDSIVSGDIVPMPTITEQVDIQPIKMESVSDHVPPAYGSESSSPPAQSPFHQQQGSPSHLLDNDETDWRPDAETLKKMTSKERRQLRNKISARNFRVRRKEYISTLEEQVKDCDDRNKELQTKNRALQDENNKLKAELKRLRQKHGEPEIELTGVESDTETVPPVTPPSSSHSDDNSSPHSLTSSSSSFSPHQAAEILDLDFMDLYASADATPNTFASFISQAVMPNWDVPTVLKGKSSDGTLAIANSTRTPVALLRDYPLLAPALLSIVVNHTFNMNYLAFSNGNFPYNEQLPAYQDNGIVVADVKRSDSLSPGLDGLSPDELDLLWDVLNKRYQTAADTPDGPIKDEELRHLSTIKEKLIKERKFRQARTLFWHTLWKLQGLDDKGIEGKYDECVQCHLKKEQQRKLKMEKKAAKSCSENCTPKRRHMTWSEKKQKIASFKIRIM